MSRLEVQSRFRVHRRGGEPPPVGRQIISGPALDGRAESYGLDPERWHDRRYMTWFLWIRPFAGPLQTSDLKELFTSKSWRDPAYRKPVLLFWAAAMAALLAAGRLDLLLWYWIVPRFTLFPVLFFWDDMLGHYNCPRTVDGMRQLAVARE